MRIAVLSGKGGTGKTLVSVNLAAVSERAVYIDCDVEEPNGHLYFKPVPEREEDVCVFVPRVDRDRCDGCRDCVDFCRFYALAYVADKVLVFDELCHSCGGCSLVCPTGAIEEVKRRIGSLQIGASEAVRVMSGILDPGEETGVPIVKALLAEPLPAGDDVFVDCPPGSACIVMESIKDADYCLLVAEPTRFGAHNLAMVHRLCSTLGLPCGVVLNKTTGGNDPSEAYCLAQGIDIVARIPFSPELGRLHSEGIVACRADAGEEERFRGLLQLVRAKAEEVAACANS